MSSPRSSTSSGSSSTDDSASLEHLSELSSRLNLEQGSEEASLLARVTDDVQRMLRRLLHHERVEANRLDGELDLADSEVGGRCPCPRGPGALGGRRVAPGHEDPR